MIPNIKLYGHAEAICSSSRKNYRDRAELIIMDGHSSQDIPGTRHDQVELVVKRRPEVEVVTIVEAREESVQKEPRLEQMSLKL